MKKLKVEFTIEVSDELAMLLAREQVTTGEVRLSLLREASEPATETTSGPSAWSEAPAKTGNAYADSLIYELQSRGFDFGKLALLSHGRVKRIIFGKQVYGYIPGGRKNEMTEKERDQHVAEAAKALGVVFREYDIFQWGKEERVAMVKIVGPTGANPLHNYLGVNTPIDLETVRLEEVKGVRGIGKTVIERITKQLEDGTIKMAT